MRLIVAALAIAAAAYLTYLAIDFASNGCDCGGSGDMTAAGIARMVVLIGGAALLYVAGAAMILVVARGRRPDRR